MKKIILIILLTLLTHCGYTSLYQDVGKVNINISVENMDGDNNLNNLIRSQLQRYKSKESDKRFLINLNSKYSKLVLTKDKTGSATVSLLSAKTIFEVKFKEKNYKYIFEESLNLNNSSNSNEQSNYEDIVKRTFAESMKDKLILKLIELK